VCARRHCGVIFLGKKRVSEPAAERQANATQRRSNDMENRHEHL
jgi:hypothetical protein